VVAIIWNWLGVVDSGSVVKETARKVVDGGLGCNAFSSKKDS
jgi:hypothetical protein